MGQFESHRPASRYRLTSATAQKIAIQATMATQPGPVKIAARLMTIIAIASAVPPPFHHRKRRCARVIAGLSLPSLPPALGLLFYFGLRDRDDPAREVDELTPGFLGVVAGPEVGIRFGGSLRFPRRCRPSGGGEERVTPDQMLVRQPLAYNGPYHVEEALAIGCEACVEAERLLVEVAEQMERLHAHVGAPDRALQEAPKILHALRVNIAVYVGLGVVHDLVGVVGLQALHVHPVEPVVGRVGVGVNLSAAVDVLADVRL